jgi:SSS family solute:Na+ symporter
MLIGDGSVSLGSSTFWNSNPDKFNAIGAVDSSIPFGTTFTGMMIAKMYCWGTNQWILQGVFGAKSLKEGQKDMLLVGFVKFLIPVIAVLPSVIAWHVFDGNLEDAE